MRLEAEFTSEPFHGEGSPPEHAVAARDAAAEAGLDTDFGPLGTLARGDAKALLEALPAITQAAFDGGATQVTLQVRRVDTTADADAEQREDQPATEPRAAPGGRAGDSLGTTGGRAGDSLDTTGRRAGEEPGITSSRTVDALSTADDRGAEAFDTSGDRAGDSPSAAGDQPGDSPNAAGDRAGDSPSAAGDQPGARGVEGGPAVGLNDALARLIADVERELGAELGALDRPGKQRAVRLLRERGAFGLRKSVSSVADALGVTRFTVYNYLNREAD